MERVFHSLKSEWLPKGDYGDFSHAVRDINQWINGYYNVYRPHTNNDGLPPCLHEEKWKQVIPVPDFVIHYSPSDRYKLYQVDGKLDDLQPAPAS